MYEKNISSSVLLKDLLTKELYQQTLTEKLSALEESQLITLPHIKNAITESAKESLGFREPNCKREKSDDHLHQISLEQKQLRVIIINTTDIEKIIKLKRKRNNILKNMTKRVNEIKEKQIDAILHELESVNDDHKMFKSVKKLHQKPFENPKIYNDKGKTVTSPQEVLKVIQNHFKNHFQKKM